MSNEEKILSMLTKMQADIDAIKQKLELQSQPEQSHDNYADLEAMTNSLTDDDKDALFEHDTWILPASPGNFDVDAAFRKLRVIKWIQNRSLKNIRLGDFVYVYEGRPVKAIHWKCRAAVVNAATSEIDDSCFWRTGKTIDETAERNERN